VSERLIKITISVLMSDAQRFANRRQGETSGACLAGSAPRLVLASASPRRRELLGWLGATFQAIATDGEEQDDAPPAELVAALPPCPVPLATHPTLLAWRKVQAACAEAPDSVIIGADSAGSLAASTLCIQVWWWCAPGLHPSRPRLRWWPAMS
jgi:hypothetical protein